MEKSEQNYCHMQEQCQLLKTVTNQYNEVVKQNKSLQKENSHIQDVYTNLIAALFKIFLDKKP